MHSYSAYLCMLRRFQNTDCNKRVVLGLVFGKECSGCGCRYGHSIVVPFMARLCRWCLTGMLISNRVLLKEYGVHFSDFLVEYKDKGGLLLMCEDNKSMRRKISTLTSNAIDFEVQPPNTKSRVLLLFLFLFTAQFSRHFCGVYMYSTSALPLSSLKKQISKIYWGWIWSHCTEFNLKRR